MAPPSSRVKKASSSRQVSEFEDRYGMVSHYMREMEFETDPNYDYRCLMTKDDEEDPQDPAPLDTLRRYFKQIRCSFGFDVDCFAPVWFDACFFPVPLHQENRRCKLEQEAYDAVIKATDFAIAEINADLALASAYPATRTSYELVELERAVTTRNWMILLTLKVKQVEKKKKKVVVDDDDDDANINNNTVTIQAMVHEGICYDMNLEQWRFKPA